MYINYTLQLTIQYTRIFKYGKEKEVTDTEPNTDTSIKHIF